MGFIFANFIKWVIGAFSGVFDIFFKYAFTALGANLSIFETVVPGVKKLNVGIVGLGLSIAKEIIQQHKGTISMESKVGEYTKVTIKLPIAKSGVTIG